MAVLLNKTYALLCMHQTLTTGFIRMHVSAPLLNYACVVSYDSDFCSYKIIIISMISEQNATSRFLHLFVYLLH